LLLLMQNFIIIRAGGAERSLCLFAFVLRRRGRWWRGRRSHERCRHGRAPEGQTEGRAGAGHETRRRKIPHPAALRSHWHPAEQCRAFCHCLLMSKISAQLSYALLSVCEESTHAALCCCCVLAVRCSHGCRRRELLSSLPHPRSCSRAFGARSRRPRNWHR